MKHFADRLVEAVKKKDSVVCVGLDPRLDKIPEFIRDEAFKASENNGDPLKAAALAVLIFNKGIIDAVCDLVPVVKPQIAFYEIFGAAGVQAFADTLDYAHEKGLITIADVKRNDIGTTAEAYASAYLGETKIEKGVVRVFDADSVTINPYLGSDGIKPFVKVAVAEGKGIFVLVKTSNKSSSEVQDLYVYDEIARGKDAKALYEIMGHYVDSFGADEIGESGYSLVGAVVGATHPKQAAVLRKIMPNSIFLVPGYGAQGGSAQDVAACFNEDGFGAVVNSSRGIIFAYKEEGAEKSYDEKAYAEAARDAVIKMNEELRKVIG